MTGVVSSERNTEKPDSDVGLFSFELKHSQLFS